MSSADWVSLLVFAAFAFFGILLPWLGRRQGKWQRNLPRKDEAARPVPDEVLDEAFEDDLLDEAEDEPPVVRLPPKKPAAPRPVPAVPRPLPTVVREGLSPRSARSVAARSDVPPVGQTLRRRRAALIGSRADARRGIVLMTVLGPCRAVDPY
jgi:hypothetical protein